MEYRQRLEEAEARYNELTASMADSAVVNDPEQYRKIAKMQSELTDLVATYREWRKAETELGDAKAMVNDSDPDLREMAMAEVERLETLTARLEERAWKVEITSLSESSVGGVNEVIALISGTRVYSLLKYESGVHRVQRVPATETQGRVHTSTITVAVMPEADEVEVQIDPKDIRVDTFCSSGPGGQSVNTTYSAVRVTHLPTGLIVSCQDEKSQIKNRAKAMQVLRSRLYQIELERQLAQIGAERKSMVGTGDRSEKIRTYNFPQNRVTDHRIGLTLHQLDLVIEGRLQPIIDALIAYYQAEKLKEQGRAA
jgi:peptide chain release factor 1